MESHSINPPRATEAAAVDYPIFQTTSWTRGGGGDNTTGGGVEGGGGGELEERGEKENPIQGGHEKFLAGGPKKYL